MNLIRLGLEKVVRLLIENGYKYQINHQSEEGTLELTVPLIAAISSGNFEKKIKKSNKTWNET